MSPRQLPTHLQQEDTYSIIYVHPRKGHNSLVVSPKLNGFNYLTWSHSMQRDIGVNNKLAFIIVNVPIPSHGDLNRNVWECAISSSIHS